MSVDRLSDGYEPRWDIDYEVGRQGEMFVRNLIESVSKDSVEVKTDEKAVDTNRIYVETECLYRGVYRPSGVMTSQADYYAYVLGRALTLFIPTDVLRTVVTKCGSASEMKRGSHPTRGFLVPIAQLIGHAMLHVRKNGGRF